MRTIVVGYDGHEAAQRALDRAIEVAQESDGKLVIVAVVEMTFNPEGPQNFGMLDDSPARMIPLVEPPSLEPVFRAARERIEAAGVEAEYSWAAGEPAEASSARRAIATPISSWSVRTIMVCSPVCWARRGGEIQRTADCECPSSSRQLGVWPTAVPRLSSTERLFRHAPDGNDRAMTERKSRISLYWLPLGAKGRVVQPVGRMLKPSGRADLPPSTRSLPHGPGSRHARGEVRHRGDAVHAGRAARTSRGVVGRARSRARLPVA